MLNLTEIAMRIRQPELCQTSDIDSLRTLCETYPYSQVFPLLYLKTLAQTNDVRLDNELQKFAYRIADRTVLFDLLNRKSKKETGLEEIIKEEEFKASSSLFTEEAAEVYAPLSNASEVDENKDPVKDKEAKEENILVSPPLTPSQAEEQIITTDLPSLPDDVLKSISIGTEVYSLETEEEKIAAQQQKQLEKEELEKEKQKLIESLIQKKPFSKSKGKNTYERSFTSWLKQNSSHTEQIEEKPDPEYLIEQFLQKDPKISSAKEQLFADRTDKNELFNPTKKAKESLDETHLPVSETLAKIFAAQGNYPKAIYAYEQLMLIFPEKKVFFASQIEDLNKKLNT